jgi:phospholipid/cholesterol/gamma-HCH transport system substrate-binding protein
MRLPILSKRPAVIAGAVALVVLIGVLVAALPGGGDRTVTAQFASAVGIYKHTPVVILGVPVGQVTKVQPNGDHVDVTMTYDEKYSVPADAVAVVVANSLVAERYIQLAPAYDGGDTLADGATIPLDRTTSPAEIDDVYAALDKVSLALGPTGANADGSLNTLLQVAAANLRGNGTALGQSVEELAKAATTLADGREDLFGTVRNLDTFTRALAASDTQVHHFEQQLATVSTELAGERTELGQALRQLTIALDRVARFVDDNADQLHGDLSGLIRITRLLVKNRASLDETLAVAPVALSNIVHAYREDLGAIGTRSDLGGLIGGGS